MKTYGGFLMSRIRQLSARRFERMLKESGIEAFNGAQGRILYVLWEHERLTITQVSKLTSLAKTTLTSMLDRMETAGLVERVPDPDNRRQIFVHITDKAKQYRPQYDRISDAVNDVFYRGFREDEVTAFEQQLRRIVANLEEEGE